MKQNRIRILMTMAIAIIACLCPQWTQAQECAQTSYSYDHADGFVDGLPVGINITGDCYNDQTVLNIAYALEAKMDYKNQIAKEVK